MVLNCSDLLNNDPQENPFTDRDFKLLVGGIHPRISGQRFWFVVNQGDANKICLYERDINQNELGKNSGTLLGPAISAVPSSTTASLNLPVGATIQVLTPGWYQDNDPLPDDSPAQWPHNTPGSANDERYQYTWSELEKSFPHLGYEQQGDVTNETLYGLNTTQAAAESLFTLLTRLHPNGHFKYFNDQSTRLYWRSTSTIDDTIELYVISDDIFTVGSGGSDPPAGQPAFLSHGKITGNIIKDDSRGGHNDIDIPKLRAEAVFFYWRFRITIQRQ